VQNLVWKEKCPNIKGTPRKFKATSINKPFVTSIKAISGLHVLPLGDGIFEKEIANPVYTPKP
jgi:hypothetical protein